VLLKLNNVIVFQHILKMIFIESRSNFAATKFRKVVFD